MQRHTPAEWLAVNDYYDRLRLLVYDRVKWDADWVEWGKLKYEFACSLLATMQGSTEELRGFCLHMEVVWSVRNTKRTSDKKHHNKTTWELRRGSDNRLTITHRKAQERG